jgi:hypothetical protein
MIKSGIFPFQPTLEAVGIFAQVMQHAGEFSLAGPGSGRSTRPGKVSYLSQMHPQRVPLAC